MIQVIRYGIYSGIREVVATFNRDADVIAALWIQANATSDSRYVIVRR
ncbi:MAG: hypothetical protein IID41_08995 [Planctomycetes bacterium]|nr:hypothetical protein [Planctomycetota bacterium]